MQAVQETESPEVGYDKSRLHTCCADCIFATYAGRTQVGCGMGRIDRFRQQDANCIIEAEDADRKFYIIDGRLCSACCPKDSEFARKHPRSQRVQAMRRALTLAADVVVVIQEWNEEGVGRTIESLKSQSLPPSQVLFAVNQDDVPFSQVMGFLRLNCDGLQYRVTDIREKHEDGGRLGPLWCIDHVYKFIGGHYYTVVEPGQTLPAHFFQRLDEAITDRLERFLVLLPTPQNVGLTVHTKMHGHHLIMGNVPMKATDAEGEVVLEDGEPVWLGTVQDKIAWLAGQQGQPYMVGRISDYVEGV